jgi:hypothetical protein
MVFWSSDTGYNFLALFFAFWVLQIVIGVILKLKNLGITRDNYRHHVQDLWHSYLQKLENPPHRNHT